MNGYETLKKVMIEDLKISADLVRPEATLEEVECDSLTLAELAVVLERDLGVELDDSELQDVASLAELGELIEERVGRPRAAQGAA